MRVKNGASACVHLLNAKFINIVKTLHSCQRYMVVGEARSMGCRALWEIVVSAE